MANAATALLTTRVQEGLSAEGFRGGSGFGGCFSTLDDTGEDRKPVG
jgi:hypothetical protein